MNQRAFRPRGRVKIFARSKFVLPAQTRKIYFAFGHGPLVCAVKKVCGIDGSKTFMRYFPTRSRRIQRALPAAFMLAGSVALNPAIRADDAQPPPKETAPAPKKLTGAELYAIHCTRCHLERSPAEFDPAQWLTLLTHMRVRANLPAQPAREILKYLQDNAGR